MDKGFNYPVTGTYDREIIEELENYAIFVFKTWYKDKYMTHWNQATDDWKRKMIKNRVEYILVQEGIKDD